MNIEEILHLFTPVGERLPEKNIDVVIKAEMTANIDLAYWTGKRWKCAITNAELEESLITHWLDLSTLTTKQRALKLAEEAYRNGVHNERYLESDTNGSNLKTFITQKAKEL